MLGPLHRNTSLFYFALHREAGLIKDDMLEGIDSVLNDQQLVALVEDALGSEWPKSQYLLQQIQQLAQIAIFGNATETYRTCGNRGCRCHHGGPKHGPHVYISARVDGRTKNTYVPNNMRWKASRRGRRCRSACANWQRRTSNAPWPPPRGNHGTAVPADEVVTITANGATTPSSCPLGEPHGRRTNPGTNTRTQTANNVAHGLSIQLVPLSECRSDHLVPNPA